MQINLEFSWGGDDRAHPRTIKWLKVGWVSLFTGLKSSITHTIEQEQEETLKTE